MFLIVDVKHVAHDRNRKKGRMTPGCLCLFLKTDVLNMWFMIEIEKCRKPAKLPWPVSESGS